MHPVRIDTTHSMDALIVDWSDGSTSRIPARLLRHHCPCSECSMRRRASWHSIELMNVSANLIRHVDLPSSNRLSIAWADGHTNTMYRFEELLDLFPPGESDGDG